MLVQTSVQLRSSSIVKKCAHLHCNEKMTEKYRKVNNKKVM